MNYIKRMETDLKDATTSIIDTLETLHTYRAFILTAPKFTGRDLDGTRKDWIATSDVAAWIDALRADIINGTPGSMLSRPKD